MIQPYPLTGTLPTPSTRKRLPLRFRSNGLRGRRRPQFRPVCAGNAEVGFLLAGCRACREQFNRFSQSSQVQTIADYAKLSLSNDQPIMLALKKFIPCYAAALCIKTHAALLAAWIESNILLQLASAPFEKQDETLVPEAGSCANCPKRTGFNKLLFPDVRKDSCTSPDCFRAKIDASVKETLGTKPQLIQISAAWNSREGAPLGRNQYVELEIKRPKANGATSKLPANQKPCDKMTEAVVMDGGKRGQVVKVCADPACRTHHPNTPSPQQVERERAEERKRIEKEKLAITTRHRVLATILQRVSAPLKKADLL